MTAKRHTARLARTLFGAGMVACGAVVSIGTAHADVIGLTFEGITNNAGVLDFYNGGSDTVGLVTGPDYGVTFSGTTLALIDEDADPPGSGNFENEPSPDTVMYFTQPAAATLFFEDGFDTGFSFFYSSSTNATVTVYGDADGTESGANDVLGMLDLVANYQDENCDTSGSAVDGINDFCHFTAEGIEFIGTAFSIDFGGTENMVAYDNITFGSASPVPLPAGIWLLGSALLGYGALRRRG